MSQRLSSAWWLFLSIGLACSGDAPPSAASSANSGPAGPKALSAPPAGGANADPDDIPDVSDELAMLEEGSAIYDQYCIACHGADGKGNNGLGGDYRKVLKDRDDEDLIASIKNGKVGAVGSMPPWGAVLDDGQIHAVLHYVKSTFGPQ